MRRVQSGCLWRLLLHSFSLRALLELLRHDVADVRPVGVDSRDGVGQQSVGRLARVFV